MAAVVFANAIRTCKADRLHAAEVLTNFLQLCKTSTPRKVCGARLQWHRIQNLSLHPELFIAAVSTSLPSAD